VDILYRDLDTVANTAERLAPTADALGLVIEGVGRLVAETDGLLAAAGLAPSDA